MNNDELNLEGGILDPLELDSTPQDSGYVPKFERDLAKAGGSLSALSEAKKAEAEKDASSDEITGEIDLSSLRSEEEYSELKAYDEQEVEFVSPDEEEEDYATLDAYNEPAPQAPVQPEPAPASSGPKSFADFAREAEEAEARAKMAAADKGIDHNLDGVQVSADILADMDYNGKKEMSRSLANQMQLDSLAMEMEGQPVLAEMSTEYAPSQKKSEDLYTKATLDKDEKQIIKERLEKEIGKRPEGYNKKSSLQMYHDLMNEQKVKKAKKGFFVVLLLVALGLITAAITYFKLRWNDSDLFMYLPFATAFFSLILFFKAKACKIFSSAYFAINTALLLGPGFIKFCIDNAPKDGVTKENLIVMLFFAAAIILSAIVCAQLTTNEKVEAYYSTHLLTEEKKVFDERKSKYKQ